jgi:DNA repair photolyase
MEQPSLFEEPRPTVTFPLRIGRTTVEKSETRSILTRASGFMSDYDYTFNPYAGCSYGCTYCYAAFFAPDEGLQANWGKWVRAKTEAISTIARMRTDLRGKTIYMSSVTDPYQPIERRLNLVRDALQLFAEREARLVVQTRSPLVVRDIDLFKQFEHLRINMTVTTDSRAVQQAFEPHCPTNSRRLASVTRLTEAGLNTCITMTPLLPLQNPTSFAKRLRATGVTRFVVQPFHAARGRFVAGTGQQAQELTRQMGWDDTAYQQAVAVLRHELPHLDEGRDGFRPE